MAAVKVVVPAVLASSTKGEKEISISGSTISEIIASLAEKYGDAFERRVLDADGKPRSVLNLYVNGKNIRFLSGLDTQLKDGDEVMLLPAVSGG
jgi:adenylyltransferase/sulfurtransferase